MKKLLVVLMILMLASFAFAANNGWWNDYLSIDSGSGDVQYNLNNAETAGTYLNGHNFGTVTTLEISSCSMNYWSDNQDRGGGAFYYKIDGGGFTEVIWTQTGPTGNDYLGSWSGSIDLLSGLSDGVHTLTVYAKSWDDGVNSEKQGDSYLSNGGNDYIATFTTSGATPITLSSFTATVQQGVVSVAWTTESETENSHFLVYRDGVVIAQVDGAGTTSKSNDYVIVDDAVVPGVHEYALADVSYAGLEKVHETIEVEVGASVNATSFVLNNAYPNPFNPRVTVSMEFGVGSNSVVSIYNTQGVLVETLVNGYLEAGTHNMTWDASNMPSGIYIVSMTAGNTVSTQKLVLMK